MTKPKTYDMVLSFPTPKGAEEFIQAKEARDWLGKLKAAGYQPTVVEKLDKSEIRVEFPTYEEGEAYTEYLQGLGIPTLPPTATKPKR